jgi:hypothetical protein
MALPPADLDPRKGPSRASSAFRATVHSVLDLSLPLDLWGQLPEPRPCHRFLVSTHGAC